MNLKDALLCAAVAVAMPTGQAMFKFAAITDARTGAAHAERLLRLIVDHRSDLIDGALDFLHLAQ